MNPLEPEDTPIYHRALPGCVLRILAGSALVIALVFLLFMAGSVVLPDVIFALAVGWLKHGTRVLPDFFAQWPSAVLPVAALVVAGWTGHRLIRWWLASRGSALAPGWTMARSAILLGLLLLCGAAAIAISGVAHQMMWLSQTEWTKSNRRTELTQMLNNIRQCMFLLLEFDAEKDRLPHSWEELLREDEEKGYADFIHHISERHTLPVMTRPGVNLSGMNPANILLISEEIEGRHALGLANGSAVHVSREQLDAILASGEMLYTRPQ
jgi:hypothetical protein